MKVNQKCQHFCWTTTIFITYRRRTIQLSQQPAVIIQAMTYVPKYPLTKRMCEPKSAIGFVRRLEMLDRRIASATDQRTRVVYRMTKSVNLLQAERRLGNVRFQEICTRLGISAEPVVMERHRRIAANASRLSEIA